MKVLAIGNSFSQDATRYLHQIAKADQFDLKVVNLYIGGCSLERHYDNITGDKKEYSFEFNGESTGLKVSVREALESDGWDYVTMQQVSHLSIHYSTYQPYLNELSGYVKKYAPGAEQLMHQTWAYEQGSQKLCGELGYKDQKEMFEDLKNAYDKAASELGIKIIPGGEVMQNLLNSGVKKIHRDTCHASLGLGRYALGAVWYECLTGNNILNNNFNDLDEFASDADMKTAEICAHEAALKYI